MILQLLPALIVIGLAAYLVNRYVMANAPLPNTCYRTTDPQSCRSIMTGTHVFQNRPNELSPLASRALANGRLQIAFGIDNAFTSSDEARVQDFVHKAQNILNLGVEDWHRICDFMRLETKTWLDLDDGSPRARIKLASMIQALSLQLVLPILFDLDKRRLKEDLGNAQLVDLAEAITRAWMASKADSENLLRFEENCNLQASLAAVFDGWDLLDPRENPLNLLLPAFETLWRIVLRIFLEIGVAIRHDEPAWRERLIVFAANPTKDVFERKHKTAQGGSDVSAEYVVWEALRLYPPTRRVHRAYKMSAARGHVHVAADVEACHISSEIWGSDVLEFKPDRWASATKEQKAAFMPFGSAPFVCPAKKVFGPRIVGLLAGILLGEMREEWDLIASSEDVMRHLKKRTRLRNERDAYDEVFLVRRAG